MKKTCASKVFNMKILFYLLLLVYFFIVLTVQIVNAEENNYNSDAELTFYGEPNIENVDKSENNSKETNKYYLSDDESVVYNQGYILPRTGEAVYKMYGKVGVVLLMFMFLLYAFLLSPFKKNYVIE